MNAPTKPRIRCAVYTRKSSEDGLEQDYNSLDAQRDASESYIASQRHEGWVLVPDPYDDGGFSGGNTNRPGLKRLLADIEARRIDIVVVYKIDRLTRSLMDFAKLIEVFDRHNVSFVSVTQQFNTTTPMGRLILNVLLSFAQFEREQTGERIRDKVAASKKKGMWMGGCPPLGYDVVDRKLIVNPKEAAIVKKIFLRFITLRSTTLLGRELRLQGIRGKTYITQTGNQRYGSSMAIWLYWAEARTSVCFAKSVPRRKPIKVGIVLLNLVPQFQHQPDLFADNKRRDKLSPLLDSINRRYGRGAIGFGLPSEDVQKFTGHAAFQRVPEVWEF